MNTTYWGQWNHGQLMSIHGIEIEKHHDTDLCHDEDDTIIHQHCCSNCIHCLDLSWRDFM
jgi:hypothetical protein